MAKKYVFIKAQPNDAKHWMNVYNGINTMRDTQNTFKETPHQVDTYARREIRPSICKSDFDHVDAAVTPLSFGYKAMGQLTEDLVAGINHTLMMESLDKMDYSHAFAAYGYVFDSPLTEGVAADKIIEQSVYFGRNEEGKLINLKTGREMSPNWEEDRFKIATWFVMLKITSDIYYIVVDPTLANIYENIETEHNDIVFTVMDAHDGTLNDTILKPIFGRGSLHMSDNLVIATGKTFKVDPYGEGVFRYRYKNYDCNNFDLRVKTNLKYTTNADGSLKFDAPADGQVGYIYFRIPSAPIIDQASIGVDSIRRSYIVVKS